MLSSPKVSGASVDEFEERKRRGLLGSLTPTSALYLLVSVRLLAAVMTTISDCDETFNYWEPTHFLAHWKGFQTWEYSPTYGLRSYAYILPHALVARLSSLVVKEKIFQFYAVRAALGVFCAFCEWRFYRAVLGRFGKRVALLTLLFLATSSGMFTAGTSFLPSTFSMYFLMLSFAAWMSDSFGWAVTMTAGGVILGWPFCIVVSIPLAFHAIIRSGFFKTFGFGLMSLVYFLVPMVLVDFYYYKRVFVAPVNIILYNVLNPDLGPTLYGTEPWYFYFLNGLLNFNFLFPLALLCIPLLPLDMVFSIRKKADRRGFSRGDTVFARSVLLYLSPLYLWIFAMSVQAHKEERFLYVVYPLLCLAAAVALHYLIQLATSVLAVLLYRRTKGGKTRKLLSLGRIVGVVAWLFVLGTVVISVSRVLAVVRFYDAPISLWSDLNRGELRAHFDEERNICVGKEWYRFPSSFFLSSPKHSLQFIRSGFDGHLPKAYGSGVNATFIIPTDMNNRNEEEMSRYVPLETCDYLVDLDFPHQTEPHYLELTGANGDWDTLLTHPFLSGPRSPMLTRSFFIPRISEQMNEFDTYFVLKRVLPPAQAAA